MIIAYDKFDTGDIGFKLLDNGDYTNEYKRLSELPYVFMRSYIKDEIRTRLPQTLYLRNKTHFEDYEIMFRSPENLGTFLQFFPNRIHDELKTRGYYFMPLAFETNVSESQHPSGSHDQLE